MAKKRKIGLAVSGGADSTALLLLMASLQHTEGFSAVVLHVDHSLRPDSADDARFVKKLAHQYHLPFYGTRVQIQRRPRESIEMAARRERLNFFAQMMLELKLDAIATGHHADDVAETFLMRLARGSGPEGLAGIKPISRLRVETPAGRLPIVFIRPLLNVRDTDLRAYLQRNGQTWREDSTNADTSILRNKVRHVVLPWLKANFDPHLTEHLCKSAAILRGDLTLAEPEVPATASNVQETDESKPSVDTPPKAFTLEIAPSIGFTREPQALGKLPAVACLSRTALAGRTLALRTWQAGDRIAPIGMNGKSRKLQDVFVTAKTPPAWRHVLPVIVDAATDEVLWVPGYRVAASAAVESPTSPSWRLTLN